MLLNKTSCELSIQNIDNKLIITYPDCSSEPLVKGIECIGNPDKCYERIYEKDLFSYLTSKIGYRTPYMKTRVAIEVYKETVVPDVLDKNVPVMYEATTTLIIPSNTEILNESDRLLPCTSEAWVLDNEIVNKESKVKESETLYNGKVKYITGEKVFDNNFYSYGKWLNDWSFNRKNKLSKSNGISYWHTMDESQCYGYGY